MKPNDAARLIGVHVNTIRNWTTDFRDYFSVTAQGGSGHMRDLTDDDVRVAGFINQLKRRGLGNDEVMAALGEAERKGFENLPSPARPETVVPMAVVPRQAAEEAIRGEQRALEIMREEMQERLQELRDLVDYERNRAEQERQRVDQSNAKILELTETIGQLKGKLAMVEQQLANGAGQ